MLPLIAGFTILASSIAGVAVLIASALLAFIEHIKPAWRYQTATKVALSLSVCYGSNLFAYCAEVAPSLLFGGPVYGRLIHTASGWLALNSHYSSILHLFLLSVLKIENLYDSDYKRSRGPWLSNAAVIGIWLVSGGLSALITDRACLYVFSIDQIIHRCENTDDSLRLLIVTVTLSGSFLLLSAIIAIYRYIAEPKLKRNNWREQFANELSAIRRNWSLLLGNELMIAALKLVIMAVTTALAARMEAWHGLAVTVCLIFNDVLALWLYFRALTRSLQIYSRIDESRRRHNRTVTFAKKSRLNRSKGSIGSRHSCRSQHSCRGSIHRSNSKDMTKKSCLSNKARNRIYPLDAEMLESTVAITATTSAVQQSPQPGTKQAWHICADTCPDHGNDQQATTCRPIPIVQIQVYRNYDGDVDSLCNYCSDSDDSLKERSLSACMDLDSNSDYSPPMSHCDCSTPTTPLSRQHSDTIGQFLHV